MMNMCLIFDMLFRVLLLNVLNVIILIDLNLPFLSFLSLTSFVHRHPKIFQIFVCQIFFASLIVIQNFSNFVCQILSLCSLIIKLKTLQILIILLFIENYNTNKKNKIVYFTIFHENEIFIL